MSQDEQKKDLGEEIAATSTWLKNAGSTLLIDIKMNEPKWLTVPLGKILLDTRTNAFLLGMGIEAAGLAIQMVLGIPIYPVVDVITVVVLIGILVWYQRRNYGTK
jgi:hypothetical protein